jgi:hypothetical protein
MANGLQVRGREQIKLLGTGVGASLRLLEEAAPGSSLHHKRLHRGAIRPFAPAGSQPSCFAHRPSSGAAPRNGAGSYPSRQTRRTKKKAVPQGNSLSSAT